MTMANDVNNATQQPLHREIFAMVGILALLYAWVPVLAPSSPLFSITWVTKNPGLYILEILAFIATSIAFFKLDASRFSYLTMLVYIMGYCLGALIVSPIMSVLGWFGLMVLVMIVAVQFTILGATWIRPGAVVEPEKYMKHWFLVLLVEGLGISSSIFLIATAARPELMSLQLFLLCIVVGFVIAFWWGCSILRTTARIDRHVVGGHRARGLQIITRSCLKCFVVVMEFVMIEESDTDNTIEVYNAIKDE
jgi:hypothetical protein